MATHSRTAAALVRHPLPRDSDRWLATGVSRERLGHCDVNRLTFAMVDGDAQRHRSTAGQETARVARVRGRPCCTFSNPDTAIGSSSFWHNITLVGATRVRNW